MRKNKPHKILHSNQNIDSQTANFGYYIRMQIYKSDSIEKTYEIGKQIGQTLSAGDCVSLIGDLGAGKTAISRGLTEGVGADADLVSSPTYVLVQHYPACENGRCDIYHLDLYRMFEPESEFIDLGTEDMLATGVLLVEWANRAPDVLPRPRYQIEIKIIGETEREIHFSQIK